ncbi:tetratricopeptide repeat protein [Aerosakkonema funiforme]|uniref:tetratricopeptide repeat protein n=1 Tax=Aerosakkonema funiforme TaxID=1246630 RepID=UPI0035BB5260
MDERRFIQELPALYENWGYKSVSPKSDRFQAILARTQTKSAANVMQLLNFAVECMEADEVYCQIGCLPVENLLGALLDNPEKMAYAVDKFSEIDDADNIQEQLIEKLSSLALDRQVFFCEQEFEEFFFDLREIMPEAKIGVYFYDGPHDYRSQLVALLLVKPFLAERALIILNHSNCSAAQQANWDFLAAHPQCQLLLDLAKFGNGIQILSWYINQENVYNWPTFAEECRNEKAIKAIAKLNLQFEKEKEQAIKNLYKEALALQHFNQFSEAEKKYREIISWDGKQANAWHNLAMLYYMKEEYQDALLMLIKALQMDSSVALYHYSFGLIMEKMDNAPEAIRAYEQAIALNPEMIDAYNNIGNIWLAEGDLDRAESIYRQAIAANPDLYGSYLNLGNVLRTKNQLDRAIEYYEKALQLKNAEPFILYNLGLAFEAKQAPAEAAEYFGYAAYREGKYEEAIEYYKKLLTYRTGDIYFYNALAECYKKLNQAEETIKTYQEGIKQHPNSAYLYFLLVISMQDFGMLEEAIELATQASQMLPNDLSLKLEKQRLLPIVYDTTAEIDYYRSRFIHHLEELVLQTNLDTQEAINKAVVGIGCRTNFYLQYQGKNDLELQIKYGEFVHKVMGAKYPEWVKPLPMPPLSEDGKIRVGYISPHLYSHSVGLLALGWLKNHDPNKIEVYSYYNNRQWDPINEQFRLYSQVFHQLPDDPQAICEQIIADNLHVLVFLDIGMQAQITQMAGLRLAPIQCTTWAHPITSGIPTIDYFLSCELMEPENATEHYSENLISLPNIGFCYSKPLLPEKRKTRAELGIRETGIVYLSSQSLYKYLPQYDYIFPAIAKRVPQAQFAFISSQKGKWITEKFRQRLQKAFASMGLNSEDYCAILPRLSGKDYMSLNLVSDVYLDTFSWSGGNTTLQAIACHLPIVTCPGEFMRGRHSYGILKMLGVTETIARNEDEYIEIAVRLGLDPEWRKNIVQKVIDNNSRVFEDKTSVVALEAFYQRVVREKQLGGLEDY